MYTQNCIFFTNKTCFDSTVFFIFFFKFINMSIEESCATNKALTRCIRPEETSSKLSVHVPIKNITWYKIFSLNG